MENTMETEYKMSDDMALGFFDADGSILMCVEERENTLGFNTLGFKVVYALSQSLSKEDATAKFAEKFDGNLLVSQDTAEFRVNQSSKEGKRVREFLLKNNPKNPYRLRDFLTSEEIITLLNQKTQQTRVGQITLARLTASKSRWQKEGQDPRFSDWCQHISATVDEIEQGSKIAEAMLAKIEVKLAAYMQTLSSIKLSNDYVLGVHYGDGSFYVALTWKPTKNDHRLRCEPEWSISGNDEEFCQIFVQNFGGATKPVDNKGQRKFTLSGIKNCLKIFSLFENAPWMPAYKKEQFNRWKKSIVLLNAQEHFTEEGIRRLLDLTYGLAEKGGRKYTKQQYLDWGLAWLSKPNRQKRTPRGEKP